MGWHRSAFRKNGGSFPGVWRFLCPAQRTSDFLSQAHFLRAWSTDTLGHPSRAMDDFFAHAGLPFQYLADCAAKRRLSRDTIGNPSSLTVSQWEKREVV